MATRRFLPGVLPRRRGGPIEFGSTEAENRIRRHDVSARVNSPRNDWDDLILPNV